jgi:hypothetical protein
MLVGKVETKEHKEGILRSLKGVSLDTSGYLLGSADWGQRKESAKLYISLILQVKKHFRNKLEEGE